MGKSDSRLEAMKSKLDPNTTPEQKYKTFQEGSAPSAHRFKG
jgi:hypothetical protein